MLKLAPFPLFVAALLAPIVTDPAVAQRYLSEEGDLRVGIVKMPYTGARKVAESVRGTRVDGEARRRGRVWYYVIQVT